MLSRVLNNNGNKRLLLNITQQQYSFNKPKLQINSRFYTSTPPPTPTSPPPIPTDNNIDKYIFNESSTSPSTLPPIINNPNEPITINLEQMANSGLFDPEDIPITGLPSFIEVVLNNFHHMTSLPWLLIIPVFSIGVRLALFPLSIKHRKNSLKLLEIKPQLDKFKEERKKVRLNKSLTVQERAVPDFKITALLKEKGCHPILSYTLPLANLPILVSSIIAFRDMATSFPSLKDAGALWFVDLAHYDTTFILPVTCASLYLIATELAFTKSEAPIMKAIKWVARFMPLLLIGMSTSIPNVSYLYWIPSALFTIGQSLIFNSKKASQYFGIPTTIKSGDVVLNLFEEKKKEVEIKYAPDLPMKNSNNTTLNNNNSNKKNKKK